MELVTLIRGLCLCFYFYFMCVGSLYAAVYHLSAVPAQARRGHHIPLGLELQTTVSHHVGTGNQTYVP